MKKPFKANSRTDRFSYLYASPVHTPRLKISFAQMNDRDAYRDYILRDNLDFYKFLGQGWEQETAGSLTPDRIDFIMNYGRSIRRESLELVIKRIGVPHDIIGTLSVYQDGSGHPWLGYYFSKCARGKGYAFEAVSAVLETIQRHEHRRVDKFETFADNKASQNLIIKLGYECVGKVPSMAGARKGEESLRFIL